MERLEKKIIKGNTYYYYSKWGSVNGKCRRIWQKYLGKLEDIVKAVEGGGPGPQYAELFDWGLPSILWRECCQAQIIESCCPDQPSPGDNFQLLRSSFRVFNNRTFAYFNWTDSNSLFGYVKKALS